MQATKSHTTTVQQAPYRRTTQISVSIQTDFRENAIQTDPWSAPLDDKTLTDDSQALKALEELTFANKLLPAHQKTMEIIDRIQQNRLYDASIPPALDPTRTQYSQKELEQEKLRVKMLVDKDIKEWARKEAEMEHVQELRINQLVDQLTNREAAKCEIRSMTLGRIADAQEAKLQIQKEKFAQKRIQRLKQNSLQLNSQIAHISNLQNLRQTSDRLIFENHLNKPQLALPQQKLTRNAVHQAVHSANSLNAPVLRPGEAPYRFAGVIRLAGTELRTQQDFDEILQFLDGENSRLPDEFTRPKRAAKQTKSYAVSSENPLPKILPTPAAALQLAYKKKIQKQIQKQLEKEGGRLDDIEEVIVQKSVQQYYFQDPPNIENLSEVDAVHYMQNMIRGVSTQIKLQNGKNRRIGLVQELRLAHELVQNSQKQEIRQQERLLLLQQNLVSSVITSAAATALGQSIDAISKSRLREQQIFRAQAILQIALRERSRRELLESQQRQKEQMQRCRIDFSREIIQNSHRELVDMIVHRVSKKAVSEDAEVRARDLALRQVEALVELDFETTKQVKTDKSEILQNILQNFLLPEVERRELMLRAAKEQQKLILAGNLAITGAKIAADRYQKQTESFVGKTDVDEVGGLVICEDGEKTAFQDNLAEQKGQVEKNVSRMEESAGESTKEWMEPEKEVSLVEPSSENATDNQ
ncbi:hypothetical protein SS50377_27087 [Spironucleus salmonicida]|uniref:Cilia- and flagella-associated protein 91 n=1 Tax=Spironucleus salmonicida TaxID=348837 RepID=V6LPY8_9EUKA|nr:hypothetical protein SS50377_27087 [Spironucleus salmonicida]|eukprot:EST46732.1 hypothetical protein SS50377_13247 [Spironucleus salmonicida]